MLESKWEKATCARYSKRDEAGHVHCSECPLTISVDWSDVACKATSHWDGKRKEWVPDR